MRTEAGHPVDNRWTMRDVLTFVIFNLIIMVLITVAKVVEDMLLAPQNTFFVGSWLFPLLATPFYSSWPTASASAAYLPDRSSYLASSTPSWADSTVHRLPLQAQP